MVPVTVPGAGDSPVNYTDQKPCLNRVYNLVGEGSQ